jgi:hypothetical protein
MKIGIWILKKYLFRSHRKVADKIKRYKCEICGEHYGLESNIPPAHCFACGAHGYYTNSDKEYTKSKLTDEEIESLAVCAFRYAVRREGAAYDITPIIEKLWSSIDDVFKNQFKNDIKREFQFDIPLPWLRILALPMNEAKND